MGFSETALQGYEVPAAETAEDLRQVYATLCTQIYQERQYTEQLYRELDVLEQLDNGRKFVPVDGITVRSPIREDWQQMNLQDLRDELQKMEKLHRETMETRKGLENAVNGLANISEKMAV